MHKYSEMPFLQTQNYLMFYTTQVDDLLHDYTNVLVGKKLNSPRWW